MKLPILQNPEFGQPCNHCGRCCMEELCAFSLLMGETQTPCRFLEQRGDEFLCGLVRMAPPELQPFMAFRMGLGVGCDAEFSSEAKPLAGRDPSAPKSAKES